MSDDALNETRGDFSQQNDRQLLARFRRDRDEGAFAELVSRHGPMVLRVCRRILQDEHAAEDVCQGVFLVLARKSAQVRWHACVANWLYGVAVRVARHENRRMTEYRQQQLVDAAALTSVAEASSESDETERTLYQELDRLPSKFRAPVVLCHLEGKTRRQAAEDLGVTETVVKGRLERGREMLRGRLLRRGIAAPAALFSGALAAEIAEAAFSETMTTLTAQAATQFAASATVAGATATTAVGIAKGELGKMLLAAQIKWAVVAMAAISTVGTGTVLVSQNVGPGKAAAKEVIAAAGERNSDTTAGIQIDNNTIDTAANCVVSIDSGSTRVETGVVISEDGYILWNGQVPPSSEIAVRFSSGESYKATSLGWSIEWRVGLLKLLDNKNWPHVAIGSTDNLRVDDICFEIGYHRANDQTSLEEPLTRMAKIEAVSQSQWFSTDLEPFPFTFGAATFDKDGRLLGIVVPGVSDKLQVSTAIEIVTSNWQSLVNAKNLDWVRFPPSALSNFRRIASPKRLDQIGTVPRRDAIGWEDEADPKIDESSFQDAKRIATSSTVRIRGKKGRPGGDCWSGVIISSDGYIATCAHTLQLPGESLTIVLADNRSVPAKALGSNWVSDIGLVKITEEGPWTCAKLGDSSILQPEGAVLLAGFPAPDSNPLNPVTTEIRPFQRTPYVAWLPEFMIENGFDTKLWGGSSGGGCFDQNGNLVGILTSARSGLRIEMLQAQLQNLRTE